MVEGTSFLLRNIVMLRVVNFGILVIKKTKTKQRALLSGLNMVPLSAALIHSVIHF